VAGALLILVIIPCFLSASFVLLVSLGFVAKTKPLLVTPTVDLLLNRIFIQVGNVRQLASLDASLILVLTLTERFYRPSRLVFENLTLEWFKGKIRCRVVSARQLKVRAW